MQYDTPIPVIKRQFTLPLPTTPSPGQGVPASSGGDPGGGPVGTANGEESRCCGASGADARDWEDPAGRTSTLLPSSTSSSGVAGAASAAPGARLGLSPPVDVPLPPPADQGLPGSEGSGAASMAPLGGRGAAHAAHAVALLQPLAMVRCGGWRGPLTLRARFLSGSGVCARCNNSAAGGEEAMRG